MARRSGAARFRIRILPSILLTAAILLLPALLYAWGRQSDSFEVARIQVTGTKRLPKKEVLRLLRNDYLGQNLFTVTREDVLATLDKLPYLAGVAVDRKFPTTLRVRVVEFRPAAYVLAKDRWYVVSDTGHVIAVVGGEETTLAGEGTAGTSGAAVAGAGPAGTDAGQGAPGDGVSPSPGASPSPTPSSSSSPAATGGSAGAVDGGDRATGASGVNGGATDPAAVAAALLRGPSGVEQQLPRIASGGRLKLDGDVGDADVLVALTVLDGLPASLRQRVDVVDVQPGGLVRLALDGAVEIEMGDTQRLLAKVLALRAVLQAYEDRGQRATFVDVSIPDRPLARPRLTS